MTARTTIRFRYLDQSSSVTLTEGQCVALRTVGKEMPHWRDGICPRRFLKSASSTSLVRLGLLDARTYPVIGYKPTGRGRAVIAALLSED